MTKIIWLFGAFLLIVTAPLIYVYVRYPSNLGRFTGLVENIIAGIFVGVLITFALDLILRSTQQKSVDRVARIGASEAVVQINHLTTLFASMVKAASDGFIPGDFASLFGPQAANLISINLGLDKNAPVLSAITWRQHISGECEKIGTDLRDISNRYQAYFSGDLITAIAGIHNSQLLNILISMNTAPIIDGIQYPVYNIQPTAALESLLDELAGYINTARSQALRLKSSIQVGYPAEIFRDDVSPKLGESRYVEEPGPPTLIGPRLPSPEQMGPVDGASWFQEQR